jgi:hypothetical protein
MPSGHASHNIHSYCASFQKAAKQSSQELLAKTFQHNQGSQMPLHGWGGITADDRHIGISLMQITLQ